MILVTDDDSAIPPMAGVPSPEETARNYIRAHGEYEPTDIPPPRRRKFRGVAGSAIVVVLIIAGVLLVLKLGNSSTVNREATVDSRDQSASDAAAVKAGCSTHQDNVARTKLKMPPTSVVEGHTLYAAKIKTTTGTFTIALNSVSSSVTVNDFVYLAGRGYYHCVPFDQVQTRGMVLAGRPTLSLPSQPSTNSSAAVPYGSVMSPLGGVSTTGASEWFVVAGSRAEMQPNSYALFGRVVAGMEVLERVDSEGSPTGARPRVLERILSVAIVTMPSPS
jgi:peptidylprolyl isomerase/peptidyl-prolyl cis-trans isomerase B (cyclophilin B)